MNFYQISLLLCLQLIFVHCYDLENATDATAAENSSSSSARKARATYDFIYADLIGCAVQSDPSCLVNVAEDFLSIKKNELLSQADQEVMRATGRSDPSNSPSELAKTMEKLISDLTGLFKNGISSFFRTDDTSGDLADDDEDEDEETKDNENKDVGEERGKKKKKKKKQWLKKLAIFGLIVGKLCLLLKLVQTGLILKLTLIGLGILIVSVAKLVILIKQGHKKTIYYENSHHDHHYENEDIWEHEHGHWDRSLDGQKLAYSGQMDPNSS